MTTNMMLEGMSLEQYAKVVDFAHKCHPFGGISNIFIPLEKQHHIKYIDNIYDSRFNIVWNVTFRGMGTNIQFRTNHFAGGVNEKPADFKFETLYDWIMAYLKCEWTPSKEMAKQMQSKN